MQEVSPLGRNIAGVLIGLAIVEALITGGTKLAARGSALPTPPSVVGQWTVSPGPPPKTDFARAYPKQTSVMYTSGDRRPVGVSVALVQTSDALRLPEKYLVDSDGRLNPLQVSARQFGRHGEYRIAVIIGVESNVINIHWLQQPGGVAFATGQDKPSADLAALLLKRPLYACDAWVEVTGGVNGVEITSEMEAITGALEKVIRTGG